MDLRPAQPALPVLRRARELGLLGPGPVAGHLSHAGAFARAVAAAGVPAPARFVDLGSGGGVPGLVLALLWPDSTAVLLDAGARRVQFLVEAVSELGLGARVEVAHGRAEDLGRGPLRGGADLVTARGFAAPPVTAECAVPLLRAGGLLAVAEPPIPDPSRWPPGPLTALGLEVVLLTAEPAICVLRLDAPAPDRFPRRVGVPGKRPLWAPDGVPRQPGPCEVT